MHHVGDELNVRGHLPCGGGLLLCSRGDLGHLQGDLIDPLQDLRQRLP
jgi:hypothetical protein